MEKEDQGKLARIVAARVKALREGRRWSLATLAEKVGTTAPQIMKLERLERKLDLNWIERLAAAFEVDPLTLFTGKEEGGITLRTVTVVEDLDKRDWKAAVAESPFRIPIVSALAPQPNAFAVHSSACSMEKLLPNGGHIIIDPDARNLQSGNIYAVIDEEDNLVVGRFQSDPARLEPMTDEPFTPPLQVGTDFFKVIGRVVASMSDFAAEE